MCDFNSVVNVGCIFRFDGTPFKNKGYNGIIFEGVSEEPVQVRLDAFPFFFFFI